MAEKPSSGRKNYGLSLDLALMKEVKHLAVDEDRNVNDVLEEAMRDVLKKYKRKKEGWDGHLLPLIVIPWQAILLTKMWNLGRFS